jgi:hypothetical protein
MALAFKSLLINGLQIPLAGFALYKKFAWQKNNQSIFLKSYFGMYLPVYPVDYTGFLL